MSKSKFPSVIDIKSELKSKLIKPIYFLFGEDYFGIIEATNFIKKTIEPFVLSDFNKENFYGSDIELSDIISSSRTFPFGDGKKLILVKKADELKFSAKDVDFINYIKTPSDFTVLIFLYEGKIGRTDVEPFKSLLKQGYLYESTELRGESLTKWIINFSEEKGKKISNQNAELLVDIVGDNRVLIEAQLEKIFEYLTDQSEITFEAIINLATKLKTYTIFDLFNALDNQQKENSLKIAHNLLDSSDIGLIGIVAMLNKHFTALLKIDELEKSTLTKEEKARITGTHPFYYQGLVKAARLYGSNQILKAIEAIYKADVLIKSSAIDEKTILSILIAEILPD
jgi:DNA polymerase-3 subunit delta